MGKACFFLLYILVVMGVIIKYGGVKNTAIFFPMISMILAYFGQIFFINKKKYYSTLLFFMLLFCSIFFIIYNVKMSLPTKSKEYLIYMSYTMSLSSLFIVFIGSLKWKHAIFSIVGLMIIFLPVILLWGYYFTSGAWLSVESCMAILQTNPSEAANYIEDHLSYVAMLGFLIIVLSIIFIGKYTSCLILCDKNKKIKIMMAVFVILNIAFLYRTRENIVNNIIYDTKVYAASYDNYLRTKEERQKLLQNIPGINSNTDKGIYILVIGESETRDHMGVYGYSRDTTPWLSSQNKNPNFIIINQAWSCAADTVSALTYALTAKNQYNNINLDEAYSLIDIANAAGYDTVWLSNQVQYGLADTPITVIASSAKQQIWLHDKVGHLKDGRYLDMPEFYDGNLIPELDKIKMSDRMLIVIHLMGSHNSYKVRYPENYEVYDTSSSEISKEDKNTAEYDNSVRYTDYVLEEIYKKVKDVPEFKVMVYFSDHGEGIDEHVGHDINRFNYQMTRIPMFFIMSNSYIDKHKGKYNVLLERKESYFTNDLIFNTMIDMMDIHSNEIDEPNNILSEITYDKNPSRFKTLYGKYAVPLDK